MVELQLQVALVCRRWLVESVAKYWRVVQLRSDTAALVGLILGVDGLAA